MTQRIVEPVDITNDGTDLWYLNLIGHSYTPAFRLSVATKAAQLVGL